MKFYIIRIKDNEQSCKVAQRCLDSLEKFYGNTYKFDEHFHFFDAITPKDNPERILFNYGVRKLKNFIEPYSRWDNVISAFTSHFSIWKDIVKLNKPGFIFEHDAVLVDNLPVIPTRMSDGRLKLAPHSLLGDIVNVGYPSYGKFNIPPVMGINPLTSKQYFPGAHAYYLTPKGAQQLIDVAKTEAGPTDVFIHYRRFNNLQEWYPWPVIAKDSFSTIQNQKGCLAKHNYNPERYKLVQVR